MKVKDIDFSSFDYKRICVYEWNQTHYPPGFEELLLQTHGEKEIEDGLTVDALGWLTIIIKGSQNGDQI